MNLHMRNTALAPTTIEPRIRRAALASGAYVVLQPEMEREDEQEGREPGGRLRSDDQDDDRCGDDRSA